VGTPHSPDRAGNADAVSQALGDLERYAGWLAKGLTQTRVRGGVQALGAAIATEGDVLASVQILEADIERLGSGGVPGLMRRALRGLRVDLAR